MSLLVQLGILIGVLMLLAVALLAWFVNSRRHQIDDARHPAQKMTKDARLEKLERPASLVSEQIEEMVKTSLATYPDLADTILDFGTMPDGTIDIWINKKQYDNVEDIADPRIKDAIKEAVQQFNK